MKLLMRLLLLAWLLPAAFPPGLAADSAGILRRDLERVFSDRRFADAQWGVEVYSLDRSETLYEKNPQRLYIPASNNKILTAAVALMRFGPEYRFKTHVFVDGPIVDGVLKGNLIVQGAGDPSSSSRMLAKDPFQTFHLWASDLKQKGIRAIAGNLIGDAGAFEEVALGRGWAWDDLSEGYAAPVSALQFNENLIGLQIAPGEKTGNPASITMQPLAEYLILENKVVTGTERSPARIEIRRNRSEDAAIVRGSLPLKASPVSRSVAVQFPVRYYLSALKQILIMEGIDAAGCEIRETNDLSSSSASLLWIHSSPPLSELLIPMLKMSLNLVAETCVRALGMEFRSEGTFSQGKEIIEETIGTMGIQKDNYSYADGSGLSRLNLVSADTLVKVLKSMHGHQHFSHFFSALPIAGVDGTLEFRLKGTKAENNVHAKTGTLLNVSSLSGYVQTADGEMLAFAFIANNFLGSKDAAENLQDRALIRLANFSRKAQNKKGTSKGQAAGKAADE
jgi:serine-type D-Ala-D-Ala carboxypeptidase/endopeptidase (penicillin-binding protein 4)